MCTICGVDSARLARLIADERSQRWLTREAPFFVAQAGEPPPEARLDVTLQSLGVARPIWVSAGPTVPGTPVAAFMPGIPTDLLLRDAISQFARVFFQRSSPIAVVTIWEPTLTPILLDVAARFEMPISKGEVAPKDVLVWVLMTPQARADWDAKISVADWRRGQILTHPSPEANLRAAMRAEFTKLQPRAGIFLGGDDSVYEDGLAAQSAQVHAFAVGSTGGAASRLLQGPLMDPTLHAQLAEPGSYWQLAAKLVERLNP